MTEPGAKGLPIQKFNDARGGCTSWDDMLGCVHLLENHKEYKTIVIDTIDMAYEQCFDWVCGRKGVEHPSELNGGKGDYGATFKRINKEFMEVIHRIMRTGRGVCFTSHYVQKEVETSSTKYFQVSPTISGKAGELVKGLVDYIWFADHCARIPGIWDAEGEEPVVLVCHGNETVIAGSRPTPFVKVFPKYLPCNVEGTYNTIEQAFKGEYEGLNPAAVVPARTSSTVVREFMSKERTKALGRKS